MLLSVIIPVFNEEKTITKVIEQVQAVDISKEIILVDDCSTDGTRALLEQAAEDILGNVKVLFHDVNRGKGAAFRTGLAKATGDFVIIQDADLEYDPEDYHKLLEPLKDGRAEVVYGSRFKGVYENMTFKQLLGNRVVSWVTRLLYRTDLSDEATCYKVFKTNLIKGLDFNADGFHFEPELTAKLLKRGIRIFEVPISYHGRSYLEGKKITSMDGVTAIWTLFKYRFKG